MRRQRQVLVGRVYDPRSVEDGTRVLVDRLWPRGLTKNQADVDEWCRQIAPSTATTDWSRIADRYRELDELTSSPVVRLNRAVAVAEADGPLAGLRLLEGLGAGALPGHRLPATRAELLARAGRLDEARTAYDEAIGRCPNLAERAHLIARRAQL